MPSVSTRDSQYLPLNSLHPSVDLASCHRFDSDIHHTYRVPSHHLLLIETGRISARTPGGRFVAKAGDLVCFRPAERNEYKHSGPILFYQVHVQFAPPPRHRLTPWIEGGGPIPERLTLGDAFDDMRRQFETLIMELGEPGESHLCRVTAAVYEMLAIIAGLPIPRAQAAPRLDSWDRVRLRLGSDLSTPLNIGRLAGEMGMSREHFTRQFRQRFGVTPRSYRNDTRVREGARLLRGTDRSVKAIAYALGFKDPKSFGRVLRHHLGVNPSDMRQNSSADRDALQPPMTRPYALNANVLPPGISREWLSAYYPQQR